MPAAAPGPENVPHVLALGGGYATISLYKKLVGPIRRGKLQLTVVDRNNFNCYHGLVPEMLTGKIQPGNILSPLRTIFRRARFRNGEVERIDLENKEVLFTRALDGREFRLNYDHLVLDLGSVENLKLFPGMAEHSLRLKTFPDILQTRHHLITMLELADIETEPAEQERLLNFVIAGGNYAGVEVAGEMAAALPRMARARFPTLPVEKIRVTLVHAGDKVLPELGASFPRLQDYTMRMLQQYPNMRLVTHCRLAAATPEEAILDTGERIPTRTIISCTGATPSPLLDRLPFARAASGRLVMDEFCRVQGQTHVWGGGDCAAVPRRDGTPAPPLAIWALTTGARIGDNIKLAVAGRELKRFRFTGLGDACIFGDKRAAAHLRGVQVRGRPGYYAWRLICLLYLPDWEKKWRVFMDWVFLPFFGSDVVNMNVHKPVGVTRVMYEAGQDIVREGDVGQSMFIVRTGEVEVLKRGENGTADVLATLGPGDHFGEAAVFRQVRRTATVRSKTRVELLHLRREVALALSESTREIAQTLSARPHTRPEQT